MPKVILTASQREEEKNAYRQREFVRILLEMKIDGISQNSIAYEMGVSPATICDWKRDTGTMSLNALRRFVEVANLTDEQILRLVRGKKS